MVVFDDLIRRIDVLDLTYVKKYRGRPKKIWLKKIRNDLSTFLKSNPVIKGWRRRAFRESKLFYVQNL
ncbi:hypothetical protein IEQ34_002709 [Dendrobium chrysotoxum]|uniref:Type II toxin-antitoxin system RelE/ParE family toxin n=1 Tax=Dendrobium chrysotoxum TaxID=161865 RepID=A0AAV7HGH9_DENCH|nr:hypothetical protein IEQ34_002709 [Dendrobium chrysotoxum]